MGYQWLLMMTNVGKTMPCLPPMTGNGLNPTCLWRFGAWFIIVFTHLNNDMPNMA
jgi:hypothetical protein